MIVDYTSLDLFTTCPMKHKLRIVDSIAPIKKSTALSYGGAWHKAQASWHEHHDIDKASWAIDNNYKDTPEDDLRTVERAVGLMEGYAELHKEEPFTVTYNERSFAMQVGEIEYKRYGVDGRWFLESEPIIYAGRFDKIVKWGKQRIYVVEHKTTSRMGPSYPSQFESNMQVDGYYMLCKELMGRCDGVLVDVVRIAKSKPKPPQTNFLRFISNRSKAQLEAGKENIVKIAKAVWYARKNDNFYQDKGSCTDYGGCAYRDLCVNNFDERIIRMRYRRSKWNALLGKEE